MLFQHQKQQYEKKLTNLSYIYIHALPHLKKKIFSDIILQNYSSKENIPQEIRECVWQNRISVFTKKIWSMWNIDFGSIRLGSWKLSTRPNELKGFKQAWLSNCMKKKSKNIMIWIHKIDRRTIWSHFGLFCPIWEKKCSQKQFTTFIIQKFWKI